MIHKYVPLTAELALRESEEEPFKSILCTERHVRYVRYSTYIRQNCLNVFSFFRALGNVQRVLTFFKGTLTRDFLHAVFKIKTRPTTQDSRISTCFNKKVLVIYIYCTNACASQSLFVIYLFVLFIRSLFDYLFCFHFHRFFAYLLFKREKKQF